MHSSAARSNSRRSGSLAAIVTSPLENLATPGGPLKREAADAEEYRGLLHSGRVRLKDARSPTNSLESRFDLAYNAAHAFSLAALRRAGYRAEKRYVVFQVLPHTLGLGPDVWRVLDKCHNIRKSRRVRGRSRHRRGPRSRSDRSLPAGCSVARAAPSLA